MRIFSLFPALALFVASFVQAQGNLSLREVLRGEVRVDLEPAGGFVEEHPPLDLDALRENAKAEIALLYGAMIYGWSFHYDIGERARGIDEELELTPIGIILAEDPRIEITDFEVKDMRVYIWSDYRPAPEQLVRMSKWKAGSTRSIQGYGHGPLGIDTPDTAMTESARRLAVRKQALEDAARAALRAMLRGSERNRPKEVRGYISLAAFPRFWLDKGQWAASGRFFVEVLEITPFAAF
ncbi:MAG: hypothetical protein LBJ31_08410 [Treponema sp.]|jgi:hypothetical protein|nr:hypothetical protein [Treponema sp.]